MSQSLGNFFTGHPGLRAKSCPDLFLALCVAGIFALGGCKKQNGAPPLASAKRGGAVYQTSCIACHNSDPRKPGPVGPEVFGSSKELLEARIMRADYPPGYKPKRTSHTMVALPFLKNDLESIYLYLNTENQ